MKEEDKRKFTLPHKFTALNGSLQYYKVEIEGVDFTVEEPEDEEADRTAYNASQEAFFKFMDVVKLKAQPVVTSVSKSGTKSVVDFCLEQPSVWAGVHVAQVSAHDTMISEAEANLKAQLEAVFGAGKVTVTINDAI